MPTILDDISAYACERVAAAKAHIPQSDLEKQCADLADTASSGYTSFAFEKALARPELSFICECKKASPSKGLIAPDFPYLDIAREYEQAGAAAISVLTEPKWFLGSDDYLREIADAVAIPCLRKDFTVDEYMIYEARILGASAILLICSILEPAQLRDYRQLADELGLSALVEVHSTHEVDMALAAGARIIGVNNRNLKDFSVDMSTSAGLRELVPEGVLFVAESGISCTQDVLDAQSIGADGVLVGEVLMRADDKRAKLAQLRGEE